MLDDMRMRMFAEHTREGYIRAVRKFAAFLGRSPDTATAEGLRRFQPDESADQESAVPVPTFVCAHCGVAMIVLQVFSHDWSIRAPPT